MRYIIIIAILIFVFISQGCIDEINDTSAVYSFDNSALILREIEVNGDYINSNSFPAFIDVDNLFASLNLYTVLDVRLPDEFSEGHIQNSINISNSELFDYINSESQINKFFVVVSKTGQAAAFYTSILRIYGFRNVYSLKFGMASWHSDFANYYTDHIGNLTNFENYHNFNNPKPKYSSLPLINNDDNLSDVENFKIRIKNLLNEGFDENTVPYSSTTNTIDNEFFQSLLNLNAEDYYIMCVANPDLFYVGQLGVFENPGHPKGAVLYNVFFPTSEMSSVNYLQTIPTSKEIILYSFSGEISAMITAQLRMLGYNAKSLLFGGHALFYYRLAFSPALSSFAYQKDLVKDFPYVK